MQASLLTLFALFSALIVGGLAGYYISRRRNRLVEQQMQKLAGWQEATLDSADYSIISTDTEGVLATFNHKAEQMLGYAAEEVVGSHTPELIHDSNEVREYAEELSGELGTTIEPGFEVFVAKARKGLIDEREWTYISKDGSEIPVLLSVTAVRNTAAEIVGFLGIATDLTEKNAMLANLRESEDRYRVLFESAVHAIAMLDLDERFVMCNAASLELFGCSRDELIGKTPWDLSPEYQPGNVASRDKARELISHVGENEALSFEWVHAKADGTPFDAEVSLSKVYIDDRTYIQAIMRDITERRRLVDRLTHLASHDSLTDLPNRKSLHEAFQERISADPDDADGMFMLLLDLDNFKEVNDTLGHEFGDQVLMQIGPRLKQACGDELIFMSRLGGDEFALIFQTDGGLANAQALAKRIIGSIGKPFLIESLEISINGSIGISSFPDHGEDSHELLRAADVAMYHAKKNARAWQLYDKKIDTHSSARLTLAAELNSAIQADQFELYYQPKINLATGRVSGLEALCRWNHPSEGLVMPDRFIDLIEMSENLQTFTELVIRKAMSDRQRLREFGFDVPIAINISARNLADDSCFEHLKASISNAVINSSDIEIEVTETAVMDNPRAATAILRELHSSGVPIVIDDFGTGYSSLSYLRQLPLSALKIDRSFVMHLLENDRDDVIVRSTVDLAHSLGLKTVAEGVEDRETADFLASIDCDEAQGYYFCRPVPFDDVAAFLRTSNTR